MYDDQNDDDDDDDDDDILRFLAYCSVLVGLAFAFVIVVPAVTTQYSC